MSIRVPASTYRLQLHAGFSLAQVSEVASYLDSLGIGDLYFSPLLKARSRSVHGYDVVDPSQINPEVGTLDELRRVAAGLRLRGMGLLLDIVPNHLCVSDSGNRWWHDVLRNGQQSPYAKYFDIDWESADPALQGKVTLPILGETFAAALEHHALHVMREASGELVLDYGGRRLPLSPESVESVQPGRDGLDRKLAALNAAAAGSPELEELAALLARQHYRLSSWQAAPPEVNYRRFFDVNDLAGVRVEDREVFDAVHALPLALAREGLVTGLRIDHVDGLHDPLGYLKALRGAAQCEGSPCYIVVEKILVGSETLATEWPIAGTTGYEALARINDVLTSRSGQASVQQTFATFTGLTASFEQVTYETRRIMLDTSLATDLRRMAHQLSRLACDATATRDLTHAALQSALREVIAAFPVYRTYIAPDGSLTARDQKAIESAIARAAERNPTLGRAAFDFIRSIMLLQCDDDTTPAQRIARHAWVLRLQQLTGAVMAKGVEDTAFYRWVPLASLDEVGATPGDAVASLAGFHATNAARQRDWPASLVATSTHDTKRSESARARIRVLSEVPVLWQETIDAWHETTRNNWPRGRGDDNVPERVAEYLFYETLVATWPAEGKAPNDGLIERLKAYLTKALREAKWRTSWNNPDTAYEAEVHDAVTTLLDPELSPFSQQVGDLVARVYVAGRWSALAEVALKITMPGVPDFYQGSEIWDDSLVDPDNRRPVDFERRRALLQQLDDCTDRCALVSELAANPGDDRTRLWVVSRALRARRAHAAHFATAGYRALASRGPRSSDLVAFARASDECEFITVAARRFVDGVAAPQWRDTTVVVGSNTTSTWRNILTNEQITTTSRDGEELLNVDALFAHFPFAILEQSP